MAITIRNLASNEECGMSQDLIRETGFSLIIQGFGQIGDREAEKPVYCEITAGSLSMACED